MPTGIRGSAPEGAQVFKTRTGERHFQKEDSEASEEGEGDRELD